MTPNPPAQMAYHYGVLMLKSGHADQAREALINATKDAQDYAGRADALKWLATLQGSPKAK